MRGSNQLSMVEATGTIITGEEEEVVQPAIMVDTTWVEVVSNPIEEVNSNTEVGIEIIREIRTITRGEGAVAV